ncbi:SDR family NAD(P)-dependent oxidoreductase [Amycolatopsis sp. H20-H5]|uniref:SDR family NAD(P)-dependent oxidoreductase n=1 Tax=Amycolatopsis sp. H20-H5 TaxID=3046309 RepID=UPI002DBC628E|nr:SDR family oxidoreductase [Amycolatopsis sp. H20-H5]MEC3979001.1 SDR family oxidoreductase [Amycolatopsis sp. H20-H5]
MDSSRIAGSVALITGGARGTGATIARRLAGLGTTVVIADVDTVMGRATAAAIDGHFVECDVRGWAENSAAVSETLRKYGKLDLVALNARADAAFRPGEAFDVAGYRRSMSVNLDGVVYGALAALPALRGSGGGEIIATTSVADLLPATSDAVYGASQAAVVGFVRALGRRWAEHRVRINALCVGIAEAEYLDTAYDTVHEAEVADAFLSVLTGAGTGESWSVLPGAALMPFTFGESPVEQEPSTEGGRR